MSSSSSSWLAVLREGRCSGHLILGRAAADASNKESSLALYAVCIVDYCYYCCCCCCYMSHNVRGEPTSGLLSESVLLPLFHLLRLELQLSLASASLHQCRPASPARPAQWRRLLGQPDLLSFVASCFAWLSGTWGRDRRKRKSHSHLSKQETSNSNHEKGLFSKCRDSTNSSTEFYHYSPSATQIGAAARSGWQN